MRPKVIIVIILFIMNGFISCKEKLYPYPNDPELSDNKGILYDSLRNYFSIFEPFDSSQYTFVNDTMWQQELSSNLYAFKEPILYNYYLRKDLYRFTWLRSFHLPMVFTLTNDKGKIILNVKKLDKHPLSRDYGYSSDPEMDSMFIALGYTPSKEFLTDEYGRRIEIHNIKADRKANIIYNSTKILSKNEWKAFETFLANANYWKLKPYDWAGDTDGSVWIIEAHKKSGYKYILRQGAYGNIKKAGEMLIELSGLKEETY